MSTTSHTDGASRAAAAGPIGILVQARMGSRRFPGKVLFPLAGQPLLQVLLERLARCRLGGPAVVATSRDASDDAIVAFCEARGAPVVRGPLEDVAGRLVQAADAHGFPAFVRVCADSPLLDPALVDRAVERFRAAPCDLVTNVFPRSYPRGQSVEVIRTGALRAAHDAMDTAEEREHVTQAFYARPADYQIVNLPHATDLSHLHLGVDTPEDAAHVAALLQAMDRPHWEYAFEDLLQLHAALA